MNRRSVTKQKVQIIHTSLILYHMDRFLGFYNLLFDIIASIPLLLSHLGLWIKTVFSHDINGLPQSLRTVVKKHMHLYGLSYRQIKRKSLTI